MQNLGWQQQSQRGSGRSGDEEQEQQSSRAAEQQGSRSSRAAGQQSSRAAEQQGSRAAGAAAPGAEERRQTIDGRCGAAARDKFSVDEREKYYTAEHTHGGTTWG